VVNVVGHRFGVWQVTHHQRGCLNQYLTDSPVVTVGRCVQVKSSGLGRGGGTVGQRYGALQFGVSHLHRHADGQAGQG
jgi:hypothetical protein